MKAVHILGAAAAITLLATSAMAADKPSAKQSCFRSNDWQGWSAPGDGDVLYLKVNVRDIYRVDLIAGSHVRKEPDNFLVSRVRGSDWICAPIDLDLTLSDHEGFRQPIFVKSLRKLTPTEVAALPPKDLP